MAIATFVHDGDAIDYTPGADVAAGDVVVLTNLIGIAKVPIANGVKGALAVAGVFDVAKASGDGVSFTAGQIVYWDESEDEAVEDDDGGANLPMGHAVAAAADAATSVRVRLVQYLARPEAS